ncbi:MAG: IPT/TIG domain-containing protein [Gammaproteobacteria bacterium]
MHRLTIPTIFALAMIGPSPNAAQLTPKPPKPVILSVVQDARNQLVISGENFGSASPLVRLGDRLVDVKRFATKQIVVDLPAGIEAATYPLKVTGSNGSDTASMAVFAGR